MRLVKCIALLSCLFALLAVGCSGRRPLNVESPVVTAKGNATEEEIFKAILRAGAMTGWAVSRVGDGHAVAGRTFGSHSATVNIKYSPQRYSITLAETTMVDQPTTRSMGSPPGGGAPAADASPTVHRTYNRWVQELDKAIRGQLATTGL